MNKNIFNFAACLGFALLAPQAFATGTAVSASSIPNGMMQYNLPGGSMTYLSLPLTAQPIYFGTVSAATADTVSVADSPAPFTFNLATPGTPYFIKFLTGSEAGRVLLITSNTGSTLTLNITDDSTGPSVPFCTAGFSVVAGDAFEIFPGDTIASVFGSGSSSSPLVLTGGPSQNAADIVTLYTATCMPPVSYYFNTNAGVWMQTGSTASANNTIIYPYSALSVIRRSWHGAATLVLSGQVTSVDASTKLMNYSGVYSSSHYATGIMLSQLHFGANWRKSNDAQQADTLSVWNPSEGQFDVFFQKADSTWRKKGTWSADVSNYVIPAGAVTSIQKHSVVTGGHSFLVSAMPYRLQ